MNGWGRRLEIPLKISFSRCPPVQFGVIVDKCQILALFWGHYPISHHSQRYSIEKTVRPYTITDLTVKKGSHKVGSPSASIRFRASSGVRAL